MSYKTKIIFDSAVSALATWDSGWIDVHQGTYVSFQIYWRDVQITWYLGRSNHNYMGAGLALPGEDITAAYRVLDPLWVDPVLADPYSVYFVVPMNFGAKFIMLGYSASNWGGGVGPHLQVWMHRDRLIEI